MCMCIVGWFRLWPRADGCHGRLDAVLSLSYHDIRQLAWWVLCTDQWMSFLIQHDYLWECVKFF